MHAGVQCALLLWTVSSNIASFVRARTLTVVATWRVLHVKIGECGNALNFVLQEIKLSELREKLDDLAAKHVSSPVGVVT